jgi:hypothetical protein
MKEDLIATPSTEHIVQRDTLTKTLTALQAHRTPVQVLFDVKYTLKKGVNRHLLVIRQIGGRSLSSSPSSADEEGEGALLRESGAA